MINTPSFVSLDVNNDNLELNISSSNAFTGVELSFYSDRLLSVALDSDRSDIKLYTDLYQGLQKVLIFSMTLFLSRVIY